MISVLYVDDEAGLLEIAKLFLEKDGEFKVRTALSAQDALSSFPISSFDAIISDYMMPNMDGIAFLKAVREKFGDIPFILFTGRGREEVVINAINNGADFYLQKGGDPVAQFAELAHKIRQAVTRRQAELSRTESEKRLVDIIDFLPDATFAIDRSGLVIAWNRAIEEMTGVPASEMLGKGDYEYAIPFYGIRRKILIDLIFEPNDTIAKHYAHIIHDKGTLIADTSLPRPKGKTVTLMGKASPLYNRKGEIVGAIESIRDITERKNAEDALLHAKKDWETIFRAIGHPAFVLDPHNRILDANDATIRATGMSLQELKGKCCYEVFHKPGTASPPRSCPCEKLRKTGQTETEEIEVEGLNGYYAVSCTPVFDDDGRLEKVIHIAMDITSRKHTEAELRAAYEQIAASEEELREQYDALAASEQRIRESEEKFRDLAELLPQAVFEMDPGLRITYANRHAMATFGLTRDDLVHGMSALSFIDPKEHLRARKSLEKLVDGEPDEEYEYTALRKDGSRFPALIYTAAVFRGGVPAGFRGVVIDITARKNTEEKIRKSEAWYRSVLRTAMDGYCIIDTNGSFTDVNDAFCILLGYSRREALALSLPLVEARETPDETARHMEEIIRNGEDRFETIFRRKDGRIIDVEVSVVYTGPHDGRFITFSRDITERKRAESALAENEQKYRSIFEATGTASVVIENDGTITLVNTEFEHLSGFSRDEIENRKKWMEFVVPEDLERMLAQHHLRRIEPEKALKHYEFRFITRSGGIREIFLTIDLIPGTTQSIASLLDITERKRTEDRLVRANQEYTDLLNQIQDVYYRSDAEGKLIRASRSFATVFGFDDLSECLGRSIAEDFYFNPADRKKFLDEVNLYGKVTNYEVRVKKKDGTPVLVETSSHFYYDPDGNVLGIEGTFRDVTERERIAKALRESEGKYRGIFENTTVAVFRTRLDGSIETANMAFARLLGYETPEEAIQGIRDMRRIYITPGMRDTILRDLASRGTIQDLEVALKRRDGGSIWVSANLRAVYDTGGNITGADGLAVDITERINAQESLRQANVVVENSPVVLFRWKAEEGWPVAYASQNVAQFGYSAEDLLSGAVLYSSIVHPDDLGRVAREVQEYSESGVEQFPQEYRIVTRDGRTRWIDDRTTIERDAEGKITYYQGIVIDITDRRQAEAEIRENEQKYRTLVETTGTGFVIIDRLGNVLDANPEYVRLTGHKSLTEIVGRNVLEWTAEYEKEKSVKAVQQCLGNGFIRNFEIDYTDVAGAIIPVEVNATILQSEGEVRILTLCRDITNRRKAENALRESEERYRIFVETADEGIWSVDTEFNTTFTNRKMQEIFGYSAEEMLGRPVWDFVPPEEIESMKQDLNERRTGKPGRYERRWIKKDGTIVWCLTSATPLFSREGTFFGSFGMFTDITEWKRTDEALRESEEKYRTLIENVQDVIYRSDRDGNLVMASPSFAQLLGYDSLDECIGKNIADRFWMFPERRQDFLDGMQEHGSIDGYEVILKKKDGIPVTVSASSHFYYAKDGTVAGVEGIFHDITDVRRAQQHVRLLAAINDISPASVIIHTPDGEILYANQRTFDLHGWTKDEFMALNLHRIAVPESEQLIEPRIEQLWRTGETSFDVEHFRKDGSRFPLHVNAKVIRWNDREVILSVSTDISERKNVENALRESREQLQQAMDASNDGLFDWNMEKGTAYFSPRYFTMLGYKPEDLSSSSATWEDLLHPDDREHALSVVDEYRQGNRQSHEMEFRLRTKDGGWKWILSKGKITGRDPEGRPVRMVGTHTDITDRKQSEREIRQTRDMFRTFIDHSYDAVFIHDTEGRVLDANATMLDMYRVTREEALSLTIDDFSGPESLMSIEKSRKIWNDVLSGKDHIFSWQARRPKDGSLFDVEVYLTRIEIGDHPIILANVRDITDRKKAEEALRESEENYRMLVEVNQNIIYSLALDGTILYVSPQTSEQLGYQPQEMEGKNFTEFIHTEDSEKLVRHIREHSGPQTPVFSDRFRVRRKDGTYRWYEDKSIYIVDHRGREVVIGTIGDITDRKKAEEALRESEEKFRLITERSPDHIIIQDNDLRYVWVLNPQLGLTQEDMIGKTDYDFLTREDADKLTRVKRQVIDSGTAVRFETSLLSKDGKKEYFEGSYLPKYDNDGNTDGIMGYFRNVTDRKRAEEAVQESEARLRSILHGSPVLQFVIDNNHRIISWNRAIEEYSGIAAADIIGTDQQWRAFYPEKRPVLADLLVDGNTDGLFKWYAGKLQKSRYVEGAYEALDFFPYMGTAGKWLSFTAAPIRDAGGSIIGAIETLEDVTERRNMEDAIHEANRKLNLLSSITRHDATNQLMVLQGFTRIAAMKESDPVIGDLLAKIDASAQTISRQIEFTKTYQDLGIHTPDWYRLDDIIERTKLGEVNYSGTCRHAEIFADPLFDRVFFNLFDNAIRHGKRVTEIAVRCERAPDGLVIIIEDNGIGIPPEEKEKIFEKGYGSHTGFGLFLAREILAITGITVRETGYQGTGARFEIAVPVGKYRFQPVNNPGTQL